MAVHILQIIIKNTSTMDFTLPLFWKLREERPDVRLSILYCVFDKRQILRKSKFYSTSFKEFGVQEYDFADFLKRPYKHIGFLLHWVFSRAPADKIHIREAYRSHREERSALQSFFSAIFYLFKNHSVRSLLSSVVSNCLVYLERSIGPRIVRLDKILPDLNADVFLFDNRAKTAFYGRDLFYEYFDNARKPVILIPHGLHFRDPVSEFCPFDEKGHPLPDYCDFWMPLRYGTPWVRLPERKRQFAVVGYPGCDSKWLRYLLQKDPKHTAHTRNKTAVGKEIKCLFIIRRYLPAGQNRMRGLDPFIVDYDDFGKPLKAITRAINMGQEEIELIVKPHPSNNYNVLVEDLEKAGINHWSVTYEPIYALLKEVDIVVSLFSTILLIPALAGIPTIIVRSKLQEHVHQGWDVLREMYTGMRFYVEDVEEFPKVFCDILSEIKAAGREKVVSHDINHLREYFPDGAITRSLQRIDTLTTVAAKEN